MKVLFAVSNDNVSSSIIKKYQEKFKEIITSKNVYYFNAIIKELQKDKTYDAVVIGEDLEPISNNNYDTIDKFIFDKLDSISDEAYKVTGEDIPIILICSDRRTKSDELLIKLFGIGIYNALLGNDRNIDMVCNLINKPRSKKEAKVYYKIDSEDVNYKPENESEVSENEIKNILNHYKRIGNNEKKCVESFDSIASQYNDTQLRIIVKFLPNSVKQILEKSSNRYQKLVNGGTVLTNGKYTPYSPLQKEVKKTDVDFLTKDIEKPNLTKPVIIPSTMNIEKTMPSRVAEPVAPVNRPVQNQSMVPNMPNYNLQGQTQNMNTVKPNINSTENVNHEEEIAHVKRRGRPKKINIEAKPEVNNQSNVAPQQPMAQVQENTEKVSEPEAQPVKRGRGRPKKINVVAEDLEQNNMAQTTAIAEQNTFNLFDLGNDESNQNMNMDNGQEANTNAQNVSAQSINAPSANVSSVSPQNINAPSANVSSVSPQNINAPSANVSNVSDQNTNIPNNDVQNNFNNDDINLFNMANEDNTNLYENSTPSTPYENSMPSSPYESSIQSSPYESSIQSSSYENNTQSNPYEMNNYGANPYSANNPYDTNSYANSYMSNDSKSNQYHTEPSYMGMGVTQELSRTKKEASVEPSNFVAQNKIVAFVGTSKNGTSFIVNNLAELLAQKGIKTAILDLTKNKNSYYMFTDNDQNLMQIATQSIKNLARGIAEGVEVNKNLTVYTSLPDEDDETDNFEPILQTLDNNYSAILMDCDFDTNINYFVKATEIYMVQSMDALTIQPLTQFLSDLKLKNVLDETKLRVIINKEMKLKILNDKMILGGMAKYNEPSMTLQRDLFNPATIKYVTIPFEMQTYARYLEAIALCQISLSGYSQNFLASLEKLANLVYPLVSGGGYTNFSPNYEKAEKKGFFKSKNKKQPPTQFSSGVNDTLNKMRSNY